MSIHHVAFSIGIEGRVPPDRPGKRPPWPDGSPKALWRILGPRVTHEFLQSQVEIGTGVCRTVGEARPEWLELRRAVAASADEFGMWMIAASASLVPTRAE